MSICSVADNPTACIIGIDETGATGIINWYLDEFTAHLHCKKINRNGGQCRVDLIEGSVDEYLQEVDSELLRYMITDDPDCG